MDNFYSKPAIIFILSLIILIVCGSCKQTKLISEQKQELRDGKYDSSPYGKSIAPVISKLSKSVKKLDVLAFYKTWEFPEFSEYSKEFVISSSLDDISISNIVTNESVAGTAFVVYYKNNLAGLLSCAHVIDHPDTVFTYLDKDKNFVKSISIKIRQQIFISGLAEGGKVEVVAHDHEKDIVFLKKKINIYDSTLKAMNIPMGSSEKLEWGSEIYVLGYPIGNLMLTKGIISIDKSHKKRLLSDAMYNKGISGSPVFAMLDGSNNFELIGIASSSSAKTIKYLTPGENSNTNFQNERGYLGDVFIKKNVLINYGVTYSIPIEEIITFIARNKTIIKDSGFKAELLPSNIKN